MKKLAKGFTLVELMIVVAIIGILSAVAIPNFMRFQAKSRQSEAKTNLKGFHTTVVSYFAEKSKFPADVDKAGFKTEGGNIYNYSLIASGDLPAADKTRQKDACAATSAAWKIPVSNDGTFVSVACGNVDNDDFIDGWSINSHGCLANGLIDYDTKGSACATAVDTESGNDVVKDS